MMNLIIRLMLAFNALSTLYIYLAIYITAQRRQRVTEPREMEEHITEARVLEGRMNRKKVLQNIKMAKSCAIVVGLVYICIIPIAVFSFSTTNQQKLLTLWSANTAYSAPSLNSIAFFLEESNFKKGSFKTFSKIKTVKYKFWERCRCYIAQL